MKTALTIAGSDSSGGAGIQADIKTMISNGVYAMSAITALTAQNTTGVTAIMDVTPEFLGEQIDEIFTDIYPDAVKIGMVSASGLIEKIADKLIEYKAKNIVVDPVMVATSGAKLITDDAISTLKKKLLPIATVLTPNIPEGEVLSGMKIENENDMVEAAKFISEKFDCAVLMKGGHQINDANDLLYTKEEVSWFKGKRINNPNTHGTGCTLSSAIASNLAKGRNLDEAVEKAKAYISGSKSRDVSSKVDFRTIESFDICLDFVKDFEDLQFISIPTDGFDLMFIGNNIFYKTIHLTANELYKVGMLQNKYYDAVRLPSGKIEERMGYTTMFVVSNSENINNLLDKLMELELTMPHVIVYITGVNDEGKYNYNLYQP